MASQTQNKIGAGVVLTAAERRARRARNIALGSAIGLFVALFYVLTLVKLSSVAHPPA